MTPPRGQEIRWTFVGSGLSSKLGWSDWHCDTVEDALRKLTSLKEKRRALKFVIKGQVIHLKTCSEAIDYLQRLSDAADPEAASFEAWLHAALRCPRGHAILQNGPEFGWWQEEKQCHACNKVLKAPTRYFRCKENCKHNVCHDCYIRAARAEANLKMQESDDCRSESSAERVELMVSASSGWRQSWRFNSRDWETQMEDLLAASQVSPSSLLIHSGHEVEVIQSMSQLQALPATSQLSLETPQALLQQLLQQPLNDGALRHLVSTLCSSEDLAAEGVRQDAPLALLQHIAGQDGPTSTVPLACTGLCALFKCASCEPEVLDTLRSQLLEFWGENGKAGSGRVTMAAGSALMRILMNESSDGVAPVLLWLLQEFDEAVETLQTIADEGGYETRLAQRHPAALRILKRNEKGEAEAETKNDGDLLNLLLDASAALGKSCGSQRLIDERKMLKEEKHFVEQLQAKLRQAMRCLKAIAPLVSLKDADLEKNLQNIVADGWDSTEWPEGQNLLHFLCEHCSDPSVVRLAAELCPNLEVRDSQNLRAMDYARRNPNTQVLEELRLVSQERCLGNHEAPEAGHEVDLELPLADGCHQDENCDSDVGSGGAPDAGDAPRAQLGSLWKMKLQLSKALKENELLREKVGELELLRTRVAILSEQPQGRTQSEQPAIQCPLEPGAATSLHLPMVKDLKEFSEPGHGRKSCLSSSSSTSCAGDEDGDASSAGPETEVAETEATVVVGSASPKSEGAAEVAKLAEGAPGDQAVPSTPSKAPPKGKGKGPGKGKASPPSPAKGESAPGEAPKGGAKGGPAKGGKGKGKAQVEPTKPEMKPAQDLKTIPWTRYVVGAQIQKGGTIWDQVNQVYEEDHIMEALPMEEIEQRFGKAVASGKVANTAKKEPTKPKTIKLQSIAPEQRFQIEVCLRTLPVSLNTGSKAVRAIQDLDRTVLNSCEALSSLRRFLCPSEEQAQELAHRRRAAADDAPFQPLIWDPVEQYMEELLAISGCAQRLSCWEFLYNLPERLTQLQENLSRFERMVHSFLNSTEIPFLLSLVLAFGNYLNGGKNEKRLGRADGFHVELLGRPGGLDLVNDTQGRNVRQLIFETFCEKYPSHSERLFEELAPVFALVQRRIGKDAQGVPSLRKSVRVEIEDLDKHLCQLKAEFDKKHQEMKDVLKLINDPAEKFVIEIPPEFDRAQQHINDLIQKKDSTLQQFKAVLANFKAETYRGDPIVVDGQVKDGNPKSDMTSEVWCKIWDDFFVPSERVLSFDEKRQKSLIEPRFCKDEPLTVESLALLWGLTKDETPRRRSSTSTHLRRASAGSAARRRASCVA